MARTKRMTMVTPKLRKGEVLVLRTSAADGTSYGGFKWPDSVGAVVEAPDWDPTPRCGHGLHGLLWGEGDGSLLQWGSGSRWQVVAVKATDVVAIDSDKVKFPRGRLLYSGSDRVAATALVLAHAPAGTVCVGASVGAGDGGTATAGYRGTATAGHDGKASAGDYGKASAGNEGTASAGHCGKASAGDRGTATAGYGGRASAGYGGRVRAGELGLLRLLYWDNSSNRYREVTAYVGENGIKANTWYQLNSKHRFCRG
ncbi:MAG: hypothetical protein KGL39_56575 [Patescibacteria group bacterium]|nr:hypothetical protein [Patescibacteria group bacterium]